MAGRIAVVGTGLVGRAWSIVFGRAGFDVAMWDPAAGAVEKALALIDQALPELAEAKLLRGEAPAAVRGRLRPAGSLSEALAGASHVQESAPERVEVKQALWRELDEAAEPQIVLASSTSGIPASAFTEGLKGRARCLVAHPINPPHIVPLVELVPAPWTDAATVERTAALMRQVGQSPIRLNREVKGFVVNRLQGALLAEAFKLVEDGVCSTADIDAAISDGLGLRWSFIGPFETIDLNSPTGVRGYCEMLGQLYYELAEEQAEARRWGPELVAKIEAERRKRLAAADITKRAQWRDRRLAHLMGAKAEADAKHGS
jgi:3-hydroxyacyl-CoA dehydrogenase